MRPTTEDCNIYCEITYPLRASLLSWYWPLQLGRGLDSCIHQIPDQNGRRKWVGFGNNLSVSGCVIKFNHTKCRMRSFLTMITPSIFIAVFSYSHIWTLSFCNGEWYWWNYRSNCYEKFHSKAKPILMINNSFRIVACIPRLTFFKNSKIRLIAWVMTLRTLGAPPPPRPPNPDIFVLTRRNCFVQFSFNTTQIQSWWGKESASCFATALINPLNEVVKLTKYGWQCRED